MLGIVSSIRGIFVIMEHSRRRVYEYARLGPCLLCVLLCSFLCHLGCGTPLPSTGLVYE
jgi:hypothetical protein